MRHSARPLLRINSTNAENRRIPIDFHAVIIGNLRNSVNFQAIKNLQKKPSFISKLASNVTNLLNINITYQSLLILWYVFVQFGKKGILHVHPSRLMFQGFPNLFCLHFPVSEESRHKNLIACCNRKNLEKTPVSFPGVLSPVFVFVPAAYLNSAPRMAWAQDLCFVISYPFRSFTQKSL